MVSINAKRNEVIVGNREALAIKKIYLNNLNILSDVEKHNDNLFYYSNLLFYPSISFIIKKNKLFILSIK